MVFEVEAGRYGHSNSEQRGELGSGVAMKLIAAQREVDEDGGIGRIVFFPDGASTGGKVTLAAGGKSYQITIDWFTGRVRMADQR